MLAALHALLNLSTESNNQAQIGKYGVELLVQLSHDQSAPNQRGFATRIIANLLHHSENRTRLYVAAVPWCWCSSTNVLPMQLPTRASHEDTTVEG